MPTGYKRTLAGLPKANFQAVHAPLWRLQKSPVKSTMMLGSSDEDPLPAQQPRRSLTSTAAPKGRATADAESPKSPERSARASVAVQPRTSRTSMVARTAQSMMAPSRVSLAGGMAPLPSGDSLQPARPSTAPVRQARAATAPQKLGQEDSDEDDVLLQPKPRHSQTASQVQAPRRSLAGRQSRASVAQPSATTPTQEDSDEDVFASSPSQPRPSSATPASGQPARPQAKQSRASMAPTAAVQPQDDSDEDLVASSRRQPRQSSGAPSQSSPAQARRTRPSLAQPAPPRQNDDSDEDMLAGSKRQPRQSLAAPSQPAAQARQSRASIAQPAAAQHQDDSDDNIFATRQQPRQSAAAVPQPLASQPRQTRASMAQPAAPSKQDDSDEDPLPRRSSVQPRASSAGTTATEAGKPIPRRPRANTALPPAAHHASAEDDGNYALWNRAAARPSFKAAAAQTPAAARPSQAPARPSLRPQPRQSAPDLAPQPSGADVEEDEDVLWQFVQGRPSTPPCTSGQPARGFNSNKPPPDPRSPRRTDFSQHPQQPARPRSLSMMSSAEASRWSSPTAPKVPSSPRAQPPAARDPRASDFSMRQPSWGTQQSSASRQPSFNMPPEQVQAHGDSGLEDAAAAHAPSLADMSRGSNKSSRESFKLQAAPADLPRQHTPTLWQLANMADEYEAGTAEAAEAPAERAVSRSSSRRSLQAALEPLDIPAGQETPPLTPTFSAPLPMGSILQTDDFSDFHQPNESVPTSDPRASFAQLPAQDQAEVEAHTAQPRPSMRKSVSFVRGHQQPPSLDGDQKQQQQQQAQSYPARVATPHPSKLQQRPSRASIAQPPQPTAAPLPADDQADAFLSGMQTTMQAMQADMLQYQEQSMQALAALSSRIAQLEARPSSAAPASFGQAPDQADWAPSAPSVEPAGAEPVPPAGITSGNAHGPASDLRDSAEAKVQRSAKGLQHAEAKLHEVQRRLAALESQQKVHKVHKHATLGPKLDPAMPPSTADLLDKRLRHMERQLAHLHGQNFGQQLTATQWRAEQVAVSLVELVRRVVKRQDKLQSQLRHDGSSMHGRAHEQDLDAQHQSRAELKISPSKHKPVTITVRAT